MPARFSVPNPALVKASPLLFSHPPGTCVRALFLSAVVLLLCGGCGLLRGPQTDARLLVWADEFDGHEPPNEAKWTYDLGGKGWGNNELQHYTSRLENVRLVNGKLLIEARREAYQGNAYTSARLVTRGRASWGPGHRIEVRAKLPRGRGTWPAIWMLGDNIGEVGWPTCGEIDIMEHVGYAPDSLFGTVHTKAFNHMLGTQDGGATRVPGMEGSYHVYAVDWSRDRIHFLVDGRVYHTFTRRPDATVAEWPFDQPHHLLLNLAVGGNWGGRYGVDETIWPQRLLVDWVRVYRTE